jgi:hypothetical protein
MTLGSEVKMSIAWHGVYRRIRNEMELLHDTSARTVLLMSSLGFGFLNLF